MATTYPVYTGISKAGFITMTVDAYSEQGGFVDQMNQMVMSGKTANEWLLGDPRFQAALKKWLHKVTDDVINEAKRIATTEPISDIGSVRKHPTNTTGKFANSFRKRIFAMTANRWPRAQVLLMPQAGGDTATSRNPAMYVRAIETGVSQTLPGVTPKYPYTHAFIYQERAVKAAEKRRKAKLTTAYAARASRGVSVVSRTTLTGKPRKTPRKITVQLPAPKVIVPLARGGNLQGNAPSKEMLSRIQAWVALKFGIPIGKKGRSVHFGRGKTKKLVTQDVNRAIAWNLSYKLLRKGSGPRGVRILERAYINTKDERDLDTGALAVGIFRVLTSKGFKNIRIM